LVTGGSGGIGSAVCRALTEAGVNVGIGYFRSRRSAEQLAEELSGGVASAIPIMGDVRDSHGVQSMFRGLTAAFGGVDILVNCAGVAKFSPVTGYAESDWDNVVDTNLKGAFLCSREAVPGFIERRGGVIVNVSSLAARIGSFEGCAYAASKAGLNALTHSLALELAQFSIRVNGVAPGRIHTSFRRAQSGSYFDFMIAQTPLRRLGRVEEVSAAVAFLASDAASFITGETIYVTGGLQSVYLEHVTPDDGSVLGGRGQQP